MATSSHIVIVGNGISGTSCARHIRKRDAKVRITIISSESKYFFSRTALMYIYMGHMKYAHTKPYEDSFWAKNRITLCYDHVEALDVVEKRVHLQKYGSMSYDSLVLALGSRSHFLDWPGRRLEGVQALYSYSDLLQMQATTRNVNQAVVVGGGLIGVELVEMLHSAQIETTFLVREKAFWRNVLPKEESILISNHIQEQRGVELRLESELEAFEGSTSNRLQAVKCKDGSRLSCQFAGIAVGVYPNTKLVQGTSIEISKGILVDKYLRTSVPDVYAIGDCAELRHPLLHRRAVEAVWYVGRIMGEALARTLTETKTAYLPGVWFNSAKFFDIEYQTYGEVLPDLPSQQDSLYWAHPNGRASLRIVFEKSSRAVLGCNAVGIRQRHKKWEKWISTAQSLQKVLLRLEEARFDEEFTYKYEPQLRSKAQEVGLLHSELSNA